MKMTRWLYLLVLGALALAACSAPASSVISTPIPAQPTVGAVSSPTPMPPTPVDTSIQPPAAAKRAQLELASRLGVEPGAVTITSIEEVEWSDSCLGAGGANEMCAAVITPGYKVILSVNGQEYEYHTDLSGGAVRPAVPPVPVIGGPGSGNPGAGNPTQDQVANALKAALAAQLKIKPEDVTLVSFEATEWPDGCLGKPARGEMCTMVITPGYRVVLSANGTQYEYRTNKSFSVVKTPDGNTLDIASNISIPLDPNQSGKVIDFQTTGADCQQVQIDLSGTVRYGKCGATLSSALLAFPERLDELKTLVATYKPFSLSNKTGTLNFAGQGSTPTNLAEQRGVMAWAQQMVDEAAGRSTASTGLALTWHRQGGFAGFCDDLVIYASGFVQSSSCKGAQPHSFKFTRLTAQQMDQLYQWLDQFQRFEFNQKDQATADAMSIRVIFEGQGPQAAADTDKALIQQFAAQVYLNAVK